MKKKVGIISLGCPKNRVDSEIMLGLLKNDDFEITNEKSEADVIIVNTCAFIESAKKESINTILEMADLKKAGCKSLIVAGCLAERYKEEILREIPEVDAVIGTAYFNEIARAIRKTYEGQKPVYCGKQADLDYLNSERILSTPRGYAYLKIAEGCDNFCTYCTIPYLRGRFRSRPIEDIINEAQGLAEKGVKELILVAQDTTAYGKDLYGERKLVELVRRISKINDIVWLRILYSYPEEIDDNFIDEVANNHKICKYIDIPIQHASNRVLKAMGRRGNRLQVENLIKRLRDKISDVIIRTSLIVGFPGEEEEDFSSLYEFVKTYEFDRLGVFTYSREENTPASRFKNQVKSRIKRERYNALMLLQKEIAARKNRLRLGKVYKAIVEGVSEEGIFYMGRTYAEAPEIDGSVYFTSRKPLTSGDFVNVKILDTKEYDLIGDVEYESAE